MTKKPQEQFEKSMLPWPSNLSATHIEKSAQSDTLSPLETLKKIENHEEITNLISILSENEKHMVIRHLGLDGQPPQTKSKIAMYIGLSRKIRQRAL